MADVSPLKVMTIVGTRPEILRLSAVIKRLENLPQVEHLLVHTGQNYDYELSEIFFKELGLRAPDQFLNCAGNTIAEAYGNIISRSGNIMLDERPDAVLVLGDTNSALSALVAKRLHIPVFHMEAGNRCFDFNVPEEVNRRIVDHIADFNLVYTEHARRHLLSEGVPHRRIYLTGSPMREVLQQNEDGVAQSDVLNTLKLEKNSYFLASFHREENVDTPKHLKAIVDALDALSQEHGAPVIVSTHPRTRNRIEEFGIKMPPAMSFLKPFGFHDYLRLQKDALCVLSDSGTISEEASLLNFPAVTIRNALERPEAMDTGSITITGLDTRIISAAVSEVIMAHGNGDIAPIPEDYLIDNTSQRVVRLILGLSKLNSRWHGLDSRENSDD